MSETEPREVTVLQPFQYAKPKSVKEAVNLLRKYGDEARILAGGQSLIPLLRVIPSRPKLMVDIKGIKQLRYIKKGKAGIRIGALAKHRDIAESTIVRRDCESLHKAATVVGYPLIRNRGTIGGNLCYADPSIDYAPPLLTLGAEVEVTGPRGSRSMKAEDFFDGAFTTNLASDEILTGVFIPRRERRSWGDYAKLEFAHGDYAVVNLALLLAFDKAVCSSARLATGAGLERPRNLQAADEVLRGKKLSTASIQEAAKATSEEYAGLGLLPDRKADKEYRVGMIEVLARRSLEEARRKI